MLLDLNFIAGLNHIRTTILIPLVAYFTCIRFFLGNETLSVAPMRVCNPDRSLAPKGCEKSRLCLEVPKSCPWLKHPWCVYAPPRQQGSLLVVDTRH
jgi:hypothetical protein